MVEYEDPNDSEDETEDNPYRWWVYIGFSAVAFVIAGLCFSPLWDEVVSTGGKRRWFANLLETITPIGVAAIAAAIGVSFLIVAVRQRKKQRLAAES